MSWLVLYVKPRHEKKLAEACRAHHITYDLPVRHETRIYQRRKVTFENPVFPGYIFCDVNREQRLELLKTNNVLRVLEPIDEARLVHELQQVRLALTADPTLAVCSPLKAGRYVRIRSGPFMGVEGLVSELKKNTKVVLNIDMIGRAMQIEVMRELLDVLE